MTSRNWMPHIHAAECIGCGQCLATCPVDALVQVAGKATLADPDRCIYCADCEAVCPQGAIELPYLIVYAAVSAKGKPAS